MDNIIFVVLWANAKCFLVLNRHLKFHNTFVTETFKTQNFQNSKLVQRFRYELQSILTRVRPWVQSILTIVHICAQGILDEILLPVFSGKPGVHTYAAISCSCGGKLGSSCMLFKLPMFCFHYLCFIFSGIFFFNHWNFPVFTIIYSYLQLPLDTKPWKNYCRNSCFFGTTFFDKRNTKSTESYPRQCLTYQQMCHVIFPVHHALIIIDGRRCPINKIFTMDSPQMIINGFYMCPTANQKVQHSFA